MQKQSRFEEEFTGLCSSFILTQDNIDAGFSFDRVTYPADVIQEFCLDKQRVREAFDKMRENVFEGGCDNCSWYLDRIDEFKEELRL